jgi:hypothetical protein
MEAETVDARTALTWARSVGITSNKLSLINKGRMSYGLPSFRVSKSPSGIM